MVDSQVEFHMAENDGNTAPIVPSFLFIDPTTIFKKELEIEKSTF